MKKQFNWLMVVAAMAAASATSCTDDGAAPAVGVGEEATVAFTVALPSGIGSRSYSDGTTATQLQYYVYDTGTTDLVAQGTATFSSLKADVSLQLVTGKTYDVLFWADKYGKGSTTPYSFDETTQSVTVSYEGATCNDEERDAFFTHVDALKVEGPLTKAITLTRPFAQINFGTDDLDKKAVADIKGTVVASVETKAYTKLNLKTGEASGEQPVAFGYATFPAGETFPYPSQTGSTVTSETTGGIGGTSTPSYSYVAMNYILVNAIDDKGLVDITLKIKESSEAADVLNSILVPNAPVQRNYRTNIYGSLLTSTALYNVSITSDFTSPDNNFAELLLAATNGGTVTLSSNTTLTESLVIAEGKDVVIDLNGKTISLSAASAASAYSRSGDAQPVIVVNGNLTLIGNGSKGKVGVSTATDAPVISVASTGKLAINGGTYYGLLTTEGSGSITVSEGTFVGFNPGAENANYVTEGSTAVEVDTDEYTVVKNTTDASEAKTTLENANSVVVIAQDILDFYVSPCGKNSTLVIKEGATAYGKNSSTYTIGLGTKATASLTVEGDGTLVGPTYTSASASAQTFLAKYGTLTIKGNVTITNGKDSPITNAAKFNSAIQIEYGGKVNIYGGYFYAYNKANGAANPCIHLNGTKYPTSGPGAYLNIYGGVYESEASNPQLIDVVDGKSSVNYNHINIYGGTFVGFNPANGDSAAGIATFVADGYEAVQTTYNGKDAWTVQATAAE